MTITKTIQKAIEGGYDLPHPADYYSEFELRSFVLDPQFWQCLDKAVNHTGMRSCHCVNTSWETLWHSFIDHLAEGKTAEDYFANLS